jgi:hypothetical protein
MAAEAVAVRQRRLEVRVVARYLAQQAAAQVAAYPRLMPAALVRMVAALTNGQQVAAVAALARQAPPVPLARRALPATRQSRGREVAAVHRTLLEQAATVVMEDWAAAAVVAAVPEHRLAARAVLAAPGLSVSIPGKEQPCAQPR